MGLDSWCRRHRSRLVACAVLALGLVGCGRSGEVSRPPVDPTPVPAVGGLRWVVPGGWMERAPTGMRAAAYEVPDGEGGAPAACSVFYFGHGRSGTMDANLNRWRNQFSVLRHDDRASRAVGGLQLTVVEIEGTYKPTSSADDVIEDAVLLGAVIAGPQGPVFVKCVGRRTVLEAARPEFAALIGSFSLL